MVLRELKSGGTIRRWGFAVVSAAFLTTALPAEQENGQSRIYLGIHWAFDKEGGLPTTSIATRSSRRGPAYAQHLEQVKYAVVSLPIARHP